MRYRVRFKFANSFKIFRTEWFDSKDEAGHFMSLAAHLDDGNIYVLELETDEA